jgi:hypothetical protein
MLQDMIDEHIYTKWHKPVQNMITVHFLYARGYNTIYKTPAYIEGERLVHFYAISTILALIPNPDMMNRLKRQKKDRLTKRTWLDKDMLHFHNIHNHIKIILDRTYCQFKC